jgi:hypothetical protein
MPTRILCIIIFCCTFSSCSCFLESSYDRFSADLLNDHDRIMQEGDSYFYRTRYSTITGQEALCTFTQFSGCDTIYRLSVHTKSSLTLNVSIEVDTEQFRLVLVDQNRNRLIPIQHGSATAAYTIQLERGYYAMKMVGYCADGVLSLQLHTSEEVEILPSN